MPPPRGLTRAGGSTQAGRDQVARQGEGRQKTGCEGGGAGGRKACGVSSPDSPPDGLMSIIFSTLTKNGFFAVSSG